MYKLIALDIDGTTFNENHEVSDTVKESIEYALNKGIKVVFVTGREEHTVKELLKQLNIDTYYGALNGSIVSKTYSEIPLVCKFLDNNYIYEIIDKIEGNNLIPIVFTNNSIFTKKTDDKYIEIVSEFINPEIKKVDNIKEYIRTNKLEENILKIGICNENDVLKNLENSFSNKINENYTISFSLPFFIEIMAKNADKGDALKTICKLCNIDLSETIAMGDGENDIPMLKISGLSFAMGNAMENVKKIANKIAKSNKEEGVAKVIREYF